MDSTEQKDKDTEITAAESAHFEEILQQSKQKAAHKGKSGIASELHDMTRETDVPRRRLTLGRILGGDILQSEWLRRQWGIIVLVVILFIIYIGNRYSSQKELIEIENLKEQLTDVKYDALTRSSELLEKTRQSKIEEYLKATNDSTLKTPTVPPYIIHEDE